MNFKIGLSIWKWDLSLLVVKRDPLLPVAIQLNAFLGPALEATDAVVVSVSGSGGPRNNDRSRFFSTDEDDSVLFFCDDDVIVPTPPCAAHTYSWSVTQSDKHEDEGFLTTLYKIL
jgi:hypothetical protein